MDHIEANEQFEQLTHGGTPSLGPHGKSPPHLVLAHHENSQLNTYILNYS